MAPPLPPPPPPPPPLPPPPPHPPRPLEADNNKKFVSVTSWHIPPARIPGEWPVLPSRRRRRLPRGESAHLHAVALMPGARGWREDACGL